MGARLFPHMHTPHAPIVLLVVGYIGVACSMNVELSEHDNRGVN